MFGSDTFSTPSSSPLSVSLFHSTPASPSSFSCREECKCTLPRVHAFRRYQTALGVSLESLTPQQLGEVSPKRTHHVFSVNTGTGRSPRYRVRICKSCSQENKVLELGTFADEESAILVNDCHEILNGRSHKLLCLVPSDKAFLSHIFVAQRCVQGNLQEIPVLTVLRRREAAIRSALHVDCIGDKAQEDQSSRDLVLSTKRQRQQQQQEPELNPNKRIMSWFSSPETPQLSNLRQCIPFVADCCASLSSTLVKYGLATHTEHTQRLLCRITENVLCPERTSSKLISNVPSFMLAIVRSSVCSFTPGVEPAHMRELMEHIEQILRINDIVQTSRQEEEIKAQVSSLEVEWDSINIMQLTATQRSYAWSILLAIFIRTHNIKFPVYQWNGEEAGAYRRLPILKSMCEWFRDRQRYLSDIVERVDHLVAQTKRSEVADALRQSCQHLRFTMCILLGVAYFSSSIWCAVQDEIEPLMEIAEMYKRFERHVPLLSPQHLWVNFVIELDVTLTLLLHTPESDRTTQMAQHSRITFCFVKAYELIRVMPTFDEAKMATYPVMPAPISPAFIFAHELAVWLVSTVCSCMLHAPEVYHAAYPDRTEWNLQQEFRVLLRLLSCCLTTLVEFMQTMNCGLVSGYAFLGLYRICKNMRTHSLPTALRLGSDAEIEQLMNQLVQRSQENLMILGSRFLIARDLLQRLRADAEDDDLLRFAAMHDIDTA